MLLKRYIDCQCLPLLQICQSVCLSECLACVCCVCESVLGGQDNLLLFAIIFRDSGNFLIIAVVAGKCICLALYMVPFNFSFFRNFHSAQAGETCVCVFPASTRAKSISRYTDSPASMSDCCCVLIDQIRHITYI